MSEPTWVKWPYIRWYQKGHHSKVHIIAGLASEELLRIGGILLRCGAMSRPNAGLLEGQGPNPCRNCLAAVERSAA